MSDQDRPQSPLDELFSRYPERLSVAELAEILAIRVPTAYKWLREGWIPAYKVGSAWVILRDEVKERILAGRNMPVEPAEDPPHDEGAEMT